MWLRDVEQKVKVVVIEGLKQPILLVCTDLALTMAQIIEIYAARFPIELATVSYTHLRAHETERTIAYAVWCV